MSDKPCSADMPVEPTAKLSRRWAFPPHYLAAVCVFCILFLYFSFMPLSHTDLWGHVLYGNWMLDHRMLPAEDPFVPLAAGRPIVATAWLSQIILAATERAFGTEGLSTLYVLSSLATLMMFTRALVLKTQRIGWALLGLAIAVFLAWGRLAFFRPETLAMPCFAALFWCMAIIEQRELSDLETKGRRGWLLWFAIPVIFALWANLHGSFAVGLVWFGCWTLGTSVDRVIAAGNLWHALRSIRFWRLWVLLAVGFAATLATPHGIKLLITTATFANNPNLSFVTEWSRLRFTAFGGVRVAASWVVLAMLFLSGRRKFSVVEVIPLAVFSLAVLKSGRFLNWYALVYAFSVLPHIAALLPRPQSAEPTQTSSEAEEDNKPLTAWDFRYTLLSGLVIWCSFALSPLGGALLNHRLRTPDQIYSPKTPYLMSQYLRERPPKRLVFNPQTFGDWLIWDGPPGLKLFITTNTVHVLSPATFRDYLIIHHGMPQWEKTLNQYDIDTVIINKETQGTLYKLIQQRIGWRSVYEDKWGAIFVRAPVGGGTQSAEGEEPTQAPGQTESDASQESTLQMEN